MPLSPSVDEAAGLEVNSPRPGPTLLEEATVADHPGMVDAQTGGGGAPDLGGERNPETDATAAERPAFDGSVGAPNSGGGAELVGEGDVGRGDGRTQVNGVEDASGGDGRTQVNSVEDASGGDCMGGPSGEPAAMEVDSRCRVDEEGRSCTEEGTVVCDVDGGGGGDRESGMDDAVEAEVGGGPGSDRKPETDEASGGATVGAARPARDGSEGAGNSGGGVDIVGISARATEGDLAWAQDGVEGGGEAGPVEDGSGGGVGGVESDCTEGILNMGGDSVGETASVEVGSQFGVEEEGRSRTEEAVVSGDVDCCGDQESGMDDVVEAETGSGFVGSGATAQVDNGGLEGMMNLSREMGLGPTETDAMTAGATVAAASPADNGSEGAANSGGGEELFRGSAHQVTEGDVGPMGRATEDEQAQVGDQKSEIDVMVGGGAAETVQADADAAVRGMESDCMEGVPNMEEPRGGLGGYQELEIDDTESQCMEGAADAAIDGLEGVSNLGGAETKIGESCKGGELMKEGASSPERRSPDSVDGDIQSTDGVMGATGQEVKGALVGDAKPEIDVVEVAGEEGTIDAAAGVGVGGVGDYRDGNEGEGMEEGGLGETAEAADGFVSTGNDCLERVRNVDVALDEGSKATEEGASCVEEKNSMELDVTTCDIVDQCSEGTGSVPVPMEIKMEDVLGDDQNMETNVPVAGSLGETGKAPAAVSHQLTEAILSDGVLNSGGVQFEVRESKIQTELMKADASSSAKYQSKADDEMRCDLVCEHIQETEVVSGLSGTGQHQAEIVVEITVGREGASSLEKKRPGSVDGDVQATEGVVGVVGQEVNDGSAGDSKQEIDVVESGGEVGTANTAECVAVGAPHTDDGPCGDQNPEEDVEEVGGSAETADGFTSVGIDCQEHADVVLVKIQDVGYGSKFIEEGMSCVEKDKSMELDVTSCDMVVGGSQAIGSPGSMELKDDGLGGDQKLETDACVAGSIVETGEALAAVLPETSRNVFSGVLNLGEVKIDEREGSIETELMKDEASSSGKNHSGKNDLMGHDLICGDVQETVTDLGVSDTDRKQAEVVVEFTEGKGDMGSISSVEISQESESQMILGSTEVADAAMPETNHEKHHEAPVLLLPLFGKNSDSQEVGCSFLRRETEVVVVPLDETVIGEAHDAVSNTINDSMIGEHDLETAYSNPITDVPFVVSENGDMHVVNDNKRCSRDFKTTEVLSDKYSPDDTIYKSDIKYVMAGVESVSSYPMVEQESRQTQIATENPEEKGDVNVSGACLLVEIQSANACPHGESLVDNRELRADSYSDVELNLSKPSELSQVSSVVSQGKECAVSLYVETEKPEVQIISSSSDEGLGLTTNEAESPVYLPEVMAGQSTSHKLDEESKVLKADRFPHKVLCSQEADVVQKLDGNAGTLMQVANEVNFDGKVQGGEQERLKRTNKRAIKRDGTSTLENDECARYILSPEEDDSFSFSNLVWGKVKSHPWWPGQIFDSSHASEMALNCQKKDGFLVAYFGDKTFAWCEETHLKPLQKYFSQMVRQSNSDAFMNAVNEVLEEVSRRVELGMTCCCLPEQTYADIKYKKFENAGIQEGICGSFIDRPSIVNDFQPGNLLEFVQALAQFPTGGADKLDLVIAQAQLKAFYQLKGYPELPVFLYCGGLVENDVEISPSNNKEPNNYAANQSTQMLSGLISEGRKKRGRKRKSNEEKPICVDDRKQKSISELMEEESIFDLTNCSGSGSEFEVPGTSILHSSGTKRHFVDLDPADPVQSRKKRFNSLRDSEIKSPSSTANGSFRVGEWIRRAASQLTGPTPILNSCSEKFQRGVPKDDYVIEDDYGVDASLNSPTETLGRRGKSEDYCSSDELLSQLCLAARDPLKGYSFVSTVVNFFTNFRESCCKYKKHAEKTVRKRGRPRKTECNLVSPPVSFDTSTPDHMQDSYWSDMIFHDTSEKKLLTNGMKRKGESHMRRQKRRRKHEVEPRDSLALGHVLDTARCFQFGALSSNMKQEWLAERPMIISEEKIVDESAPTELILNFNKPDSIPSETDLIRIFSRYGPLKEAETEVLRMNNCAKLVFKKRADAEIAFSSAGKFSIFGSALLSYKLRYLPSTPKASPNITPQGIRDAAPADDENTTVPAQTEYSASPVGDTAQAGTGTMATTEPENEDMAVADADQAELGPLAIADLAQLEAGTVSDPAQPESGVLAGEDPAQAETGALVDPAQAENRAQAVAGPAQLDTVSVAEVDPVQTESGALTEADQAQPETCALAESDPAQAETSELAVGQDIEIVSLAEVDPAQAMTGGVTEECREKCALAEADAAQEGTITVEAADPVSAQAESVEVAVANLEKGETVITVMDPDQAESRELAVFESTS